MFTVRFHLYNLFESDGNCIKAVTNLLMSCYTDRLVLCWSVESWPSLSSRPGELSKRIPELSAQDGIKGRRYTMHGGLEYLKSTSRNLEKDGLWGKADPYVLLTLGDQKAKSGTVGNTQVLKIA